MDAGVDEAEFDASPEAMLYATATGQVLTSLGGRSVVQVNTDRAKQLLPVSSFGAEMSDLSQAKEQVRTQLVRLLALPHERSALQSRTLSSNVRKKQRIEEIQLESEPGVRIVGWLLPPMMGLRRICACFTSAAVWRIPPLRNRIHSTRFSAVDKPYAPSTCAV